METKNQFVVALAGNPNVGKSTVFNSLTGMKQHTGNWSGKTVSLTAGNCTYAGNTYRFVDLPGTYSIMPHSAEEEIARNYICFHKPDLVVVVCDSTCLKRNLNLALQILEVTPNVLLCLNMADEAKKKGIEIDQKLLSELLHIPVISTNATSRKSLSPLLKAISEFKKPQIQFNITYPVPIEEAVSMLIPVLDDCIPGNWNSRFIALRLLDEDEKFVRYLCPYIRFNPINHPYIKETLIKALQTLRQYMYTSEAKKDCFAETIIQNSYQTADQVIRNSPPARSKKEAYIDNILTNKWTGIPIMLLFLFLIFWITITGANYPSAFLSHWLFRFQDILMDFTSTIGFPSFLQGVLILGVYRIVAWVVSVMLPPMAIFFPLFTLLEDSGFLPRIAFNLDHTFHKSCACGKQALTMCMGFGCNAVGVTGCRIIDSPRERLIAILTNSLVPCNGRFPTLLAIITIFFVGKDTSFFSSGLAALGLTSVILLGIGMTFAASKLLSSTILKGLPSAFTLELPPYRKPQFGKVIIRSLTDRTLFVLGRAVTIAAPAGALIWLLANIKIGNGSAISYFAGHLQPLGHLLGMDGIILMAFILGFPANEIVIPIIAMTYLSAGTLVQMDQLPALHSLLLQNGWTGLTAVCTILFTLFHWPCSTTCLTIYKETGSARWTMVSIVIPVMIGTILCFLVSTFYTFFSHFPFL